MKKAIIAATLLLGTLLAKSQNQTIKLYLQQIAANKVYIEYLQKGYKIARNGLTTIGDIKNGHFKLGDAFFSSLENVSPAVKKYGRIADIIAANIQIAKTQADALARIKQSLLFTPEELKYIEGVFRNLLKECGDQIDDLTMVLSVHSLKMSDDERIKRIDLLYQQMEDRKMFCSSFSSDLNILALQRTRETSDIRKLKALYGKP